MEFLSIFKALQRGETPTPIIGEGYCFESLDAVKSVLTDNRLNLWRAIRDKKPASISELAKMVGRGFREVHRDVQLLEEFELISLKKTKGKRGDLQAPISLADELLFAVA